MRKAGYISLNAPVILGLTFLSLAVLGADALTDGLARRMLAARYTSWLDPLMYLRFFTGPLVHADFAHYVGNIMLALVAGPMVEEKYGSKRLLYMMLFTAFATGLCNVLFFPHVAVIGASGLVFMLILLSSFANFKSGGIPLTLILVAVLYIGNEVWNGLFDTDNISQMSHIVGGACGAVFGFALGNKR